MELKSYELLIQEYLSKCLCENGDKQKAVTTINQTINIGRREKIAESHQKRLEAMLSAFQNMDNL